MADFDYGNARLRAQMVSMLSRQTLSMLAQSVSLQILMAGLAKTPYRRSIERAQTNTSGISLLEPIFNEEVHSSVQKLLTYYDGNAIEQIRILLAYEDVQNLKVILRGIQKGVEQKDISDALSHWGSTPLVFLQNVAGSKNVEEAVARLAILGNSAAKVLSALTSEQLAHSAEVDYALEKWFFQEILLENTKKASECLLFYFRLCADIFDILTICARFFFPNLFKDRDASNYLLGQGTLPVKILRQSAVCPSLEQAILNLQRTPYFNTLHEVVDKKSTVTLVRIERLLRKNLWDWVSRQPRQDPLGIGVPIAFMHKKKREIECLRHIAYGIQLGLQPGSILANMETAA